MNCLTVENLTVEYSGRRVLGPISWKPEGRLVGIIGPNGVGKTTLLMAIAGVTHRKGRVSTCSRPAFMPAQPMVDPLARVRDVIAAGLYGVSPDPNHVSHIIERMGIEGFLDRRFGSLSSGEKRLVCIARTLARKSKVVLLDEPLSFLDVSNQARVLQVLREYAEMVEGVVLATTHELHYLVYFDTILLLFKGRVAYSGDPASLGGEVLERVYGVEIEMLHPGIFVPKPLLEGRPSGR